MREHALHHHTNPQGLADTDASGSKYLPSELLQ